MEVREVPSLGVVAVHDDVAEVAQKDMTYVIWHPTGRQIFAIDRTLRVWETLEP